MVFSRRLLNHDEYVVVSTHTHVKALLLPAFLLIVLAAATGYLGSLLPAGREKPLLWGVLGVLAFVVAVWWVVKPFLRWLTTTYTVTNRRMITRTGILSRRGHDIPLHRISDVAYERGLWDRLLGCGTLLVADASEHGRVELHDIPRVETVHLKISDLLYRGGAVLASDDQPRNRLFDDGS